MYFLSSISSSILTRTSHIGFVNIDPGLITATVSPRLGFCVDPGISPPFLQKSGSYSGYRQGLSPSELIPMLFLIDSNPYILPFRCITFSTKQWLSLVLLDSWKDRMPQQSAQLPLYSSYLSVYWPRLICNRSGLILYSCGGNSTLLMPLQSKSLACEQYLSSQTRWWGLKVASGVGDREKVRMPALRVLGWENESPVPIQLGASMCLRPPEKRWGTLPFHSRSCI